MITPLSVVKKAEDYASSISSREDRAWADLKFGYLECYKNMYETLQKAHWCLEAHHQTAHEKLEEIYTGSAVDDITGEALKELKGWL